MPGRIIGASIDAQGNPGYRMALQTREQHIRREKATSNICTAQVLLSVMAGMYAVYHGPQGLKKIANRIHGLTQLLAKGLSELGYSQLNEFFFDTLKIKVDSIDTLKKEAESKQINLRYHDSSCVGISIDETTTTNDVEMLVQLFSSAKRGSPNGVTKNSVAWAESLRRTTPFLTHPVFNAHHSEHEMLRYIKRLENKDLSMVHSMISLGSCTMKLNATTEMIPVTWAEFGRIHPFAPADQVGGYKEMLVNLENWLKEIT